MRSKRIDDRWDWVWVWKLGAVDPREDLLRMSVMGREGGRVIHIAHYLTFTTYILPSTSILYYISVMT